MKLARAIHFDESDQFVFASPARTGEWCISGGFEFSDWTEGDLVGKARQAFANGWLGLETFGRVTFVAVTQAEPSEIEALELALAQHFVTYYGAPSVEAARPVAREEIFHMGDLCEDHDPNTLLTVSRELTEAGVNEAFRVIEADQADLSQFAVHGDAEPLHGHDHGHDHDHDHDHGDGPGHVHGPGCKH
ncbi:DUF6505 family protein [Ponticoccus alexandrii]|uniref:Uncharacterized protein n=1 Tax=Ponticoccus alexandrii TaxID=1943633 RepID=A0ABX7F5H7_9RHOB|nr:DUF6505 family protein [Ponticoccus alexandrii]ETA53615.1 hypothetical protein P279_02250 [Rhodobacteraceae bacterium PD-2]QRF64943.1 hypothetical protein GQA70_00620 [Ponticoccus alexandrii]